MSTMIIHMVQGADFLIPLVFKQDNGTSVRDITGFTVGFMAKKWHNQPDAQAALSYSSSSHTDASNGITRVDIPNTSTNISPGIYYATFYIIDDLSNIEYFPKDGNAILEVVPGVRKGV